VITAEKFNSHNLWTLPNHHSQLLEGVDFKACFRPSAQTPIPPHFENQTFWGNYRKVFSLILPIKHFALNLLSWVCLNIQ